VNKTNCVLICFLLLIISGCISGKVPEIAKGPIAPPCGILAKIAMPSPGDGIIRATADITLSTYEGRYSRKTALLLKRPASMRIETVPVFGPADFFFSANEKYLKVFLPGEAKFYVGKATKENFFLFFKVPLSPGDMVSMLVGLPPQIMEGNISEYMEGKKYRFDIRSGQRKQSLWVSPEDYRLTKIEEIDDGRLIYRATFADSITVGGASYPGKIDIETENPEKVSLHILYRNLDVLPDENTELFDLQTPCGLSPVFVD